MSMSMWLGLRTRGGLWSIRRPTVSDYMPGVRLGRLARGFQGFMMLLANVASAATPTTFDFSSDAPSGSIFNREWGAPNLAPSPGWSTGGGRGGSESPFALTWVEEGATPSPGTGPSNGVGGSEVGCLRSSPR